MKRMCLFFTTGMVIGSSALLYAGTGPGSHVENNATNSTMISSFPASPAPATLFTFANGLKIAAVATTAPQTITMRRSAESSIGMEFLQVPGGCFKMGSNADDVDEQPVHNVCLDFFFVGKYEVTQGQWQQIMGSNPSFFSSCGSNCPVDNVSWNDVQEFIRKLNQRNKANYRLLTEAEWEYTCRSGGKSERFCGNADISQTAWYDKNSSSNPHPSGEKRPNGLGVYDMSGNVWEWVSDWYDKDYYGSVPGSRNPVGPPAGATRVIRGGSWYNDSKNVRASMRSSDDPDHRSINVGFRLAYPAH